MSLSNKSVCYSHTNIGSCSLNSTFITLYNADILFLGFYKNKMDKMLELFRIRARYYLWVEEV